MTTFEGTLDPWLVSGRYTLVTRRHQFVFLNSNNNQLRLSSRDPPGGVGVRIGQCSPFHQSCLVCVELRGIPGHLDERVIVLYHKSGYKYPYISEELGFYPWTGCPNGPQSCRGGTINRSMDPITVGVVVSEHIPVKDQNGCSITGGRDDSGSGGSEVPLLLIGPWSPRLRSLSVERSHSRPLVPVSTFRGVSKSVTGDSFRPRTSLTLSGRTGTEVLRIVDERRLYFKVSRRGFCHIGNVLLDCYVWTHLDK